MSRTYRKREVVQALTDKERKKEFNRKLRRNTKGDVDAIPNGGAYRKLNKSWEICEWKFGCSWEQFKRWDWTARTFDSEEEARAYWLRHYKYR